MEAPRKILFKAKRLDNGEWIDGYYTHHTEHWHEIISYIRNENNEIPNVYPSYPVYRIHPTTLSQFTGWKDRHGNRIFENDIVEIVSSGKRLEKYLIWWNREMSMMEAVSLDWIDFNGNDYYNGKNPQFHYDTFCLMLQDPWGDFRDIKVIGNLFDNYEMIKEALND